MSIPLRLEQFDTVLYNSNLNPMGVPKSVIKVLEESLDSIVKYPDIYYDKLKKSISYYTDKPIDNLVIGSGSSDLIRLFVSLIMPKKSLLLIPSFSEYESVLTKYGCECNYYYLNEDNEFELDAMEFIRNLDSSYDIIFLGNPNNPTSKIIPRADMEVIATACKELGIFLVIDEMYIEFVDEYENVSATSLTSTFDNIAILRSVSKFFAVPGIRLAYAIMNNSEYMDVINLTTTPSAISTLTAAAGTVMFNDSNYIDASRTQIQTERHLIYSAMLYNKNVKLFKPQANFMLVKILKDDIYASDIAEHCKLKGIVIRRCDDIKGLSNKYIRFCFMKPSQNDLLVNTILEKL